MRHFAVQAAIRPEFAGHQRHGRPAQFGWAVEVKRYVSPYVSRGAYKEVPECSVPALPSATVVASMWEHRGTSAKGKPERAVFRDKRVEVRFERQCDPWGSRWYDFGRVVVAEPFQDVLRPAEEATYVVQASVLDAAGQAMASAGIAFANRPTYVVWDVEMPRPGGMHAVVNGRRMITGVRSLVFPGDFLGDGRAGFLYVIGSRYLSVHDPTGKRLWERTDPAGADVYNSTSARPFDINADGRDEIICMLGHPPEAQLAILDGRTGSVLRSCPWPHAQDDLSRWHHGGNRGDVAYTLDAKVYVANLRGRETPQDIVAQTGDDNRIVYTALTHELEQLWEFDVRASRGKHKAAGAHCAAIADVDHDGRDEVAAGTYMLDHDGKVMWVLPFQEHFYGEHGDDHIDQSIIVDLDRDGELEIAYANNCVVANARTGKVLWRGQSEHGQSVAARKMLPKAPGLQLVFGDKKGPPQIYDAQGSRRRFPPWPRSGKPINWDGDAGTREWLTSGMVWDEEGRAVGVAAGCDEHCPLTPAGTDCIWTHWLDWNGFRVQAYSGVPLPPAKPGRHLLVPRRVYNHID